MHVPKYRQNAPAAVGRGVDVTHPEWCYVKTRSAGLQPQTNTDSERDNNTNR